jgi:hypothetical protein
MDRCTTACLEVGDSLVHEAPAITMMGLGVDLCLHQRGFVQGKRQSNMLWRFIHAFVTHIFW